MRLLRRTLCIVLSIPIFAYCLLLSDTRRPLISAADRGRDSGYFRRQGDDYVTNDPTMTVQRFPAEKAPGTFRVFVIGGSQAMGSPYVVARSIQISRFLPNEGGIATWLRTYLQGAWPETRFEVINAASAGQGIDLHWAIFKEAVAVGRPDAIVLLSGRPELEAASDALFAPFGGDVARAVKERGRRIEEYLGKFAAMADASLDDPSGGVRLYVLTVPSNLRDWVPFGKEDAAITDARRLLAAGKPEDALRRLRPADASALRLFYTAKSYDALGRFDEARAFYLRARDADPQFLRTRGPWNDILRKTNGPAVRTFDLEKLAFSLAKDGIPGFDLFHDYGHFRLEINQKAALEIVKGFLADGLVPAGGGPKLAAVRLEEVRLPAASRLYLDALFAAQRFKWWRYEVYQRFGNIPFVNAANVKNGFRRTQEDFDHIKGMKSLYENMERR